MKTLQTVRRKVKVVQQSKKRAGASCKGPQPIYAKKQKTAVEKSQKCITGVPT